MLYNLIVLNGQPWGRGTYDDKLCKGGKMRKDSILNMIFPVCEHCITVFLLTEISALNIHATLWFKLGVIAFEPVDPVQARLNWLQFSSVVQSCPTLCNPVDCSTPGLPVHHQLPELAQTHVHWVSDAINHLILCRPLLLPLWVIPSIRVFSNESVLRMRWPKY